MSTAIKFDVPSIDPDAEFEPYFYAAESLQKKNTKPNESAVSSATQIELERCPTICHINRDMLSRHGRPFAYLIKRDFTDFEPLLNLVTNEYVLCINHECNQNPFTYDPEDWNSLAFGTQKTSDLMENHPLLSIGSKSWVKNIRTSSITHFFHDAKKHGALNLFIIGKSEIYLAKYAYTNDTHESFDKSILESKTYNPFKVHSLAELEEAVRNFPWWRFQREVCPVHHFYWNEIGPQKSYLRNNIYSWSDMA